jgi:peptide/nickel transport system permease protein
VHRTIKSKRVINLPRRLRPSSRSLAAGVLLLSIIILAAVLAPLIATHDPAQHNSSDALSGPSGSHFFGTDQFGRDVFSRTLFAARMNLIIAFVIVGIAFTIGTALGVTAGWVGGLVDVVIMRVVDIALAFPFLVLVICIVGMRGPGLISLFVAVSLVAWVFYARLVRGEVIVARQQGYVLAAQASDFSTSRIIVRHLLPNVIIQPLVFASSDLVYALLLGASVSFLGLGVQPPTPEWGQMVMQGKPFMAMEWWIATFPGIAVVVTAVSFALIGDGLADLSREGRS